MIEREFARALRKGRATEVRELLRGLDEPQRKALRPAVAAFERQQRADDDGGQRFVDLPVAVARAGTGAGPAGLVGLLTRSVWQWRSWDRVADELVVATLLDRAPSWLPDLVERAAAQLEDDQDAWEVVERLRGALGVPRPRSEGYLRGLAARVGVEESGTSRGDLVAALRADPELRALVPALLVVPDVGVRMGSRQASWVEPQDPDDPAQERVPAPPEQTWPVALRVLSDEGLLDRAALLDTVLDVLLRGGKRPHLAHLLLVHQQLEPTAAEVRARLRSYVGLLEAGTSTAAGEAQRLLRALDADLPGEVLAEATGLVLARREKALATTQLAWAERAARRDPEVAAALLPALAVGLRHERRDVQERTLAALGVLLPLVPGEAVRSELAAEAALLPPGLQAEAAALLGAPVQDHEEDAEDTPLPGPAALPPPVRDLRALADAVAQHLETGDAWAGERVLDGVAVLHVEPGFADALAPFLPRLQHLVEHPELEASVPVVGLLQRLLRPTKRSLLRGPRRWRTGSGPSSALALRAAEVDAQVRAGLSRPLLALPDTTAGLVDPERVAAELARRSAPSGTWDLQQAVLRLPPDLPAHLRLPGAPVPLARVEAAPVARRSYEWDRGSPLAGLPAADVGPPDGIRPDALLHRVLLLEPSLPVRAALDWWERGRDDPLQVLLALPAQREVAAAHLVAELVWTELVVAPSSALCLALLPEAAGPTGRASALAVGYALANKDAGTRTAAVDALHGFAAAGAMEAATAGGVLGELLQHEQVKPGRVASALAEALRGPRATRALVRDALLAALPALLPARRRGLHELLAVAADAAAGGAAPVPGLDALADERGSTRLHVEARRLREALRP